MHTTRQGKAHQGLVELAYEVTHPLEEERDTPGLIFVPAIMPAHIAVWSFTLYFAQDIRPLLPRLQLPVLVISGERDRTMPPAAGADVVARLPHAKQVVIPQVGHLLHLTAAATINRLIDKFLAIP